eukprot:8111617-Lingulodinium_polyedra.AAC.1
MHAVRYAMRAVMRYTWYATRDVWRTLYVDAAYGIRHTSYRIPRAVRGTRCAACGARRGAQRTAHDTSYGM